MLRKTAPSRDPSRRTALAAAGAGLASLAVAGCGRGGQAAAISSEETVLGDPNAPVTIIEYASVTCPHCKAFHDTVFPELQARYIDTGKVCFVFRQMPTNPGPLSMAGFMTARCAPDERFYDVLDLLFEHQVELMRAYEAGEAREELLRIAQPMGITEEEFDACVRDDAEMERILQMAEDGGRSYGVTGTPTFVINGETYPAMPIEQLSAIIDPLLGS